MNENVIYVGIDVDDVRYHGSALDKRTGEVRAVSAFDGLIFTIGDGPSAIVTAASTPRSFPRLSERRIVDR